MDTPVAVCELVLPVSRTLTPITSVVGQGQIDYSPRIERAAMAGLEPEHVEMLPTVPPTPACGRLYEYRCPPIPRTDSIYKQAKKAEYEGRFDDAMKLYLQAIEKRDRSDSAIKDYAGLLHMRGRTEEAIDFLEKCARTDMVKSTAGFKNLITQLRSFLFNFSNDSEKRDLPRLLYVAIADSTKVRICASTLPSLFPNHLKVSKIFYVNPILDDLSRPYSKSAVVEFASHSAARKALMVNKHSSLQCFWASENMLSCDNRIVKVEADPKADKFQSTAAISYVIVPEDIVSCEWPKLLQNKSNAPDAPQPDIPAPASDIKGSLQLPVLKRSENRPLEVDVVAIEASVDHMLQEMHWCLDTPSPVRSIACLL